MGLNRGGTEQGSEEENACPNFSYSGSHTFSFLPSDCPVVSTQGGYTIGCTPTLLLPTHLSFAVFRYTFSDSGAEQTELAGLLTLIANKNKYLSDGCV